VEEAAAVGTPVFIHEDESGTGDGVERAPTLREALHERGLACAELALQADEIAGLEDVTEPHADATGLLGAAAEELEGVFIQDGHAKIIRQGEGDDK
jgi:hypothetical protein